MAHEPPLNRTAEIDERCFVRSDRRLQPGGGRAIPLSPSCSRLSEMRSPPYASDSSAQDRQERALLFFKADSSATIADLASRLECSHRTAERIVSDLRRSGRLRREGSTRAGAWRVIDDGGST